jgi:glycogen debranching enzyme
MDECADHDGDGFVDYVSQSAQGLFNQGWKDSGNAICHHDGVLARPPIALVEVQGYVYRARTEIARLLRHMGEPEAAERQEQSAADLRRHFEKAFWMPEREFLALALEEGGRQVDSLTSNAGQALWGGIVEVSQAAAVAERLLERRFFSGWGVRTLATSESAYNPTDYQVGSVWPHDNSLIVSGLNDYGHHPAAVSLFTATFEAAALFPDYRLPEVFAGFSRDDYAVPVRYPVACRPQAWAAGALPYMLISCLGLRPHALEGGLEVRSPHLPEWLPEVTVRELRCGDGVVDLRFERNRDATTVAVVRRQGDIRLRVEY